jgi:hypothetical protein
MLAYAGRAPHESSDVGLQVPSDTTDVVCSVTQLRTPVICPVRTLTQNLAIALAARVTITVAGVAMNCTEAQYKLQECKPDVILLDASSSELIQFVASIRQSVPPWSLRSGLRRAAQFFGPAPKRESMGFASEEPILMN